MSQTFNLEQDEQSVRPIIALKAEWLKDARQMMILRRLHLAQEWNIPLSMLADPPSLKMPPINVTQTSTKPGLGSVGSALVGAAITLGTGGAGFGLFQALKPAVETVLTRDADISVGQPIVEPPQEE